MTAMWLKQLDVSDLIAEAPPLAMAELSGSFDIETAASYLWKDGPFPPQGAPKPKGKEMLHYISDDRPPKHFWEHIKHEVFLLVCTKDRKYARLRKSLDAAAENGKVPMTGLIAATIGDKLGVEAAVISGLCAVALYAVLKVDKEAYCSKECEHYT
ncbi:hypothetical protein [Cyanobium sp. LEGE 06113]|uniref:hypothetical protein n=1 Tax=Cyanobium sp. LEGE 06113 TaxID=1297573 RepID=UPI001882E693|nr:hypothetical protein [Cyanobium sp. LEGE 06113]MBE9153636.1 hypothetical protein [Cyanobium sp. LEGE 06113]